MAWSVTRLVPKSVVRLLGGQWPVIGAGSQCPQDRGPLQPGLQDWAGFYSSFLQVCLRCVALCPDGELLAQPGHGGIWETASADETLRPVSLFSSKMKTNFSTLYLKAP